MVPSNNIFEKTRKIIQSTIETAQDVLDIEGNDLLALGYTYANQKEQFNNLYPKLNNVKKEGANLIGGLSSTLSKISEATEGLLSPDVLLLLAGITIFWLIRD